MKKIEFYVRFGVTQTNCETVTVYAFTYLEAVVIATAERMKKGFLTSVYCVEDEQGGYVDDVRLSVDYHIVKL